MGKHKNANCSLDQCLFSLLFTKKKEKNTVCAKRQRAAVNARPEQINVKKIESSRVAKLLPQCGHRIHVSHISQFNQRAINVHLLNAPLICSH